MVRRSIAVLVALTTLSAPTLSVARAARTEEGKRFYVASFGKRITDHMRSALASVGVAIVDYYPDNSYLVWADHSQANAAARLRAVRSVNPLPARSKVHSDLLKGRDGLSVVQVTVAGESLLDQGPALLQRFGDVLGITANRPDGLTVGVRLRLFDRALGALARHASVLYVAPASTGFVPEDERTDQILAGNIGKRRQPRVGYPKWLKSRKLDGTGIVVAVVDTGISTNHPDLEDRVAKRYNYAGTFLEGDTDLDAHGTHVAGIIGGVPRPPTDFADGDGFVFGLGVAPRVRLVSQNLLALTGPASPPRDLDAFASLSRDSWRAGARMWNSSWHTGEGERAGYVGSARSLDVLARNAVPKKRGAEQFLYVFSAGNAGSSGPTSPKEAKNIISVGSTRSGRPSGLLAGETNIDEVSSFSSKGPTKDGRIFPVVSAPGENVVSARAPEGTRVCDGPLVYSWLYCSLSGTSMAAPHATGASALVHQWWKRRFRRLPSPAMVKALLVNSATDMGKRNVPNMVEGWGRINLGELFAGRRRLLVDQRAVLRRTRARRRYSIKVKGRRRPLKVTLAWSDAPAAVGARKALVNDLDLVVERLNGRRGRVVRRWRGNVFRKGRSVSGRRRDRLNNVENVYILSPKRGRYRITVRAFNLPGDGVPGNRDKTDQDFALVARWGRR